MGMRVLSLALLLVFGCGSNAHEDPPDSPLRVARARLSADGTRTASHVDERLAAAPVPVLAPADRDLERPTLAVGREYASLTGRDHGVTIHVQGTRSPVTRTAEVVAPTRDLRGVKGYVSQNEGIRTATWIEGGIAYSADIECAAADDARCQDESYLLTLIERLVVVGGAVR